MGYTSVTKWGIALLSNKPEKVDFFDTTLRDGEQTPGVSLTSVKKLVIARSLDKLGVKVIEAGFAAVSKGEKEAVKLIASEGLNAEICSATRSVKGDIDAAIEAGVDSVNIIIPTSDLHIMKKLDKNREDVLDITTSVISYAKDHGIIVEICLEDGSRTDMDYLKRVIKRAMDAKVDRITPCDTVGTLTPEKAYDFYGEIHKAFPDLVLGVHCHNDFGLAVANSLAAVVAGATHFHGTINGLGERAGNASLEEMAVALKLLYGIDSGIDMTLLQETSQVVSRTTGMLVQANKAIVGANAFAHESGIHTHAILRDPSTYESIDPSIVGAVRRIATGKHTGSAGLSKSLTEMGFATTPEQFDKIFQRVKNLGDEGKPISDTDLYSLAEDITGSKMINPLILEEFIVTTGNKITPTASVKLRRNGAIIVEAETGNGPVDATINAINKAILPEQRVNLDVYHVEAITGGTDAVVNVEVRLKQGEKLVTSRGVSEDIVKASVDAYLKGVNVYSSMTKRKTGEK
jgi:D-citramalate synthase